MNVLRIIILLLVVFLSFASCAVAEIIVLKSGKTIDGKIIRKTNDHIEINFHDVVVNYYLDEIVSIDEQGVDKMLVTPAAAPAGVNSPEVVPGVVSVDPKDVFEARLSRFLPLVRNPDWSEQEKQEVVVPMEQFSQDYPQSKFAKDAQFLVIVFRLRNEVFNNHLENATAWTIKMEELVRSYPGSSLEDFTQERLIALIPEVGMYCIPFEYIVLYLRGRIDLQTKNFQSVIDKFSVLKSGLDFSKPKTENMASEVYVPLIAAYEGLRNRDKADELLREVTARFPDEAFIEKIRDNLKRYRKDLGLTD